jgi:uncharacterized protein YjbJ (UPF0337 family)
LPKAQSGIILQTGWLHNFKKASAEQGLIAPASVSFPQSVKKPILPVSQSRLFRYRILFMTDETKNHEESSTKERLEGIAQVVIGEIQSLGGVITGDPTTSAEGDFNVQVGTLHQESAEALDEADESKTPNTNDPNQTA